MLSIIFADNYLTIYSSYNDKIGQLFHKLTYSSLLKK